MEIQRVAASDLGRGNSKESQFQSEMAVFGQDTIWVAGSSAGSLRIGS
jgi:hypothetical protein